MNKKERLKYLLEISGNDIPEFLKIKLERELDRLEGRTREDVLPGEDKSWYKRVYAGLKEHKPYIPIKDYLEKFKEEIKIEIDNELFDCRMQPGIFSDEAARELAIKNQMNKMGISLTNFFRR